MLLTLTLYLGLVLEQNIKIWKKTGQEMTLTFNTHLLSFTEFAVCIYSTNFWPLAAIVS